MLLCLVQERLIELALFSLEKRRLWGNLRMAFQYLRGGCKKEGDRLFSRICCERTRGKGFNLKEGRFKLDIRKKMFTTRMVRHWYRLPREVVGTPSLETFKVRGSEQSDGSVCVPVHCRELD